MSVFRQVLKGDGRLATWHKWNVTFSALAKWGPNVITAYGGEPWRRHRRAIGPAFTHGLCVFVVLLGPGLKSFLRRHQKVWNETLITYEQMLEDEGWLNEDAVEIPGVQRYTSKFALLVIAKCGFGLPYHWSSPPTDVDGKMSIQEALRFLADTFLLDFIFPSWVLRLPFPSFSKRREAHRVLLGFLKRETATRLDEVRNGSMVAEERANIFNLLVLANEQESVKVMLSDEEVARTCFILEYDHDSDARVHRWGTYTPSFSRVTDIQDEILQHIISVVGHNREPPNSEYERLNKVAALFFESMRLFPGVYLTLRKANEDTILDIPDPMGSESSTRLAVQKDTLIMLDLIGLQRNPRYFENPDEFRPSRWYNGIHTEVDGYAAFGVGPRACIGRKFATAEVVAFLTMFIRDWRIEPALNAGETLDGWRDKVISQPVLGLMMNVKDAPVRLTRRRYQ
ncbi:hypothetical protein H0H93_009046 [Arthromyces matolae]|nr:hypothetical protein H0H93_009046 [Arthromyces matolae]